MLFLVKLRPRQTTLPEGGHEAVHRLQAALGQASASGTLQQAWGLAGGGHVLLMNAKSHNELAALLRTHPLWSTSAVEIEPLVNINDVLLTHLAIASDIDVSTINYPP